MTLYYQRGSRFDIGSEVSVTKNLPIATYQIRIDGMTGQFYLDLTSNFEHKSKVYGDTMSRVERIYNTFDARASSTGVLLSGEKGSGKTLLAKMLSIDGIKRGVCTLLVNSAFYGPAFNTFLQSIDQPCVVLFDEFEKIYDNEQQDAILTLLDGTFSTQKMFVMTCNEKHRINSYMVNRPGRFFYALNYTGLSKDFIVEYCNDNLDNKNHIQMIVRFAESMYSFNFDMLQAIVEEMNRYKENLIDVLKFLNVSATDAKFKYKITKFELIADRWKDIKPEYLQYNEVLSEGRSINVFEGFYVYWNDSKAPIKDDEEHEYEYAMFTFADVLSYTPEGTITARSKDAYVEFTKHVDKSYSVMDYL